MLKKKETVLEALEKELPNMTEAKKNYLIGWLEGFSAGTGVGAQEAAERDSA